MNKRPDSSANRQRFCVVTRERDDPENLIRFVLSPDGYIVPDLTERLPGRGMWLKADKNIIHKAIEMRSFSRAMQCQVTVPENLVSIIRDGLRNKIKDSFGFARRAGQITYGFVKVREKISQNIAGLIIQAIDGSEEEKKRILSGTGLLPVMAVFTAKELGMIFGREYIVHAAIYRGPFVKQILFDNKRLSGIIN